MSLHDIVGSQDLIFPWRVYNCCTLLENDVFLLYNVVYNVFQCLPPLPCLPHVFLVYPFQEAKCMNCATNILSQIFVVG